MSLCCSKDVVDFAIDSRERELNYPYRWQLRRPWLIGLAVVIMILVMGWSWWLIILTLVLAFVAWLFIDSAVSWVRDSKEVAFDETSMQVVWYLVKSDGQRIELMRGFREGDMFEIYDVCDPSFAAVLYDYQQEEEWLAEA